jgi:ribosomal protein S18 acetylase RimI-like enzyme
MIIFKTASVSHAGQITQLVNSAYRGDASKAGWTTEADLLDGQRTDVVSIEKIILEPHNFIELAVNEETDELLALVHLKHYDDQTLYFGMLTVNPALQDQGIGKRLLVHIEEYAIKNHFSQLKISVLHLRPELIAYYERRGFKATGNSIPFPEDDPHFGIPKVKDLKLLEFIKAL